MLDEGLIRLTSEGARKAWLSRERAKVDRAAGRVSPPPVAARPRDQTEMRAATAHDQARIARLVLPPAWTNVQLSVDPKAELQATGKDIKGKTQYRYTAAHDVRVAAEKFARLKDFAAALPDLRTTLHAERESNDAALVVSLLDATAIRIGSDTPTAADVQAIGASTLTTRHIRIRGDTITLDFIGKKGVKNHAEVTDAALAAILQTRIRATRRGGRLFDTTDNKVRDYLSAATDDQFTPKDFRTHAGTAEASRVIKTLPVPRTPVEFKRARLTVAKAVAKKLSNQPAQALKSYINPAVFSRWIAAAKVTSLSQSFRDKIRSLATYVLEASDV